MAEKRNLAFANGHIIDGHPESKMIHDGVILINNAVGPGEKKGRITAIGRMADITIPDGYQSVDLKGRFVIPGLINAHAHLIGDGKPRNISSPKAQKRLVGFLGTWAGKKLALKKIRHNVTNALNAGVTTIRAVGDPHAYDLVIRGEVQEGKLMGPRIHAAGKLISSSGGHGAVMGHVADSPWEARKAVRKAIYDGADFIKITSTGGVSDSTREGEAGRPAMTLEEISAVCDEAHRFGLKVAGHVHSPPGIREALLGGVDTIEHGASLDEEAVNLFKNNPRTLMGYTALVPTLSVIINITDYGIEHTRFSRVQYENALIVRERMISAFQTAVKHGIKTGVGTDAGVVLTPHYDVWKELVHFVEYGGLTPHQAIYRATRCSAEILGIEKETGTIEEGKSADFCVLDGNPLEDLTVLSRPSMVVCFGNIIDHPVVNKIKEIEAIVSG